MPKNKNSIKHDRITEEKVLILFFYKKDSNIIQKI